MTEADDATGTPPSPCVRNCCLDDESICMGCFRSISEICEWHGASDAEKRATLARCRARHQARNERWKNA